jgi:hypothetical protein
MKRFLLFASYEKYDYGRGWETFYGSYGTLKTTMNHVSLLFEWWHIVDTNTMQVVRSND